MSFKMLSHKQNEHRCFYLKPTTQTKNFKNVHHHMLLGSSESGAISAAGTTSYC
jgi:hypothetical protein